jgi:hypothetical protein
MTCIGLDGRLSPSRFGSHLTSSSISVPLGSFCALLFVFALKHFVADFLLQTSWIAHGKERATDWLAPLAVHVLCHAGLTLCIALVLAPRLWWLAPAELVLHACIDRSKSLVGARIQCTVKNTPYWWLLGFDQFLHQVTNIALAAAFFLF